jgi:hypothetical protein
MKKFLLFLFSIISVFGMIGPVSALPITGTGTFGGHEYEVVSFGGTWEAARDAIEAKGEGWYFADITSKDEQNFIAGLLGDSAVRETIDLVWVGGYQNLETKNWVWDSTGEFFTYTNWAPGEPNNSGGDERYLALDKRLNSDWLWNDAHLDGTYDGQNYVKGYVAERPAPVPEPATMFLLGSGLIGVGVFVRRKFKR